MTRLNLAAIELHEDEVPDLHDRVARSIHVRRGVLGIVGARSHVVVDLAAWTTRTRLAHLPEVIFLAEAQDAFARRADFVPEPLRIFVSRDVLIAAINREPQTLRIELQLVNEQIPRIPDRVVLEVVA